jgi:hypothetical protein
LVLVGIIGVVWLSIQITDILEENLSLEKKLRKARIKEITLELGLEQAVRDSLDKLIIHSDGIVDSLEATLPDIQVTKTRIRNDYNYQIYIIHTTSSIDEHIDAIRTELSRKDSFPW